MMRRREFILLLGGAEKSGRTLTDGMKSLFGEPSAFLPKPYTDHDLIHAVAELLRPAQGESN